MLTSIIIVTHPQTGQEINVAPLLLALSEFDASPSSTRPCAGITQVIRNALRVINVSEHVHTPPGKLVDIYSDLHRLEDVFDAMNVPVAVAA